jgi:hypothetical protein
MKLSKIAILALRGMGSGVKDRIAAALGVSTASVYNYIKDNNDNLTKAAVLDIIKEETGLEYSEILVEDELNKIVEQS